MTRALTSFPSQIWTGRLIRRGRHLTLGTDYTFSASTLALTFTSTGFAKFDNLPQGSSDIAVFHFDVTDAGVVNHNTLTVTINGLNDAPALTPPNPILPTVTADQISNGGQTVSSFASSNISDVDAGAVQGIAITALSATNGSWQYSIDNGTTWNAISAVSDSAALLLRASDLVRFVPDGHNGGTDTITYRAWDQTSGTAGTLADTSSNGGTSAFSSATDTAQLTVAAWSLSGDTSVTEGGAASYTVQLAGTLQAGETATVHLALTDISTTSADYASFSAAVATAIGSRTDLSFDAGTGTLTYTGTGSPMANLVINLGAIDDSLVEGSEQYRVVLSNPGTTIASDHHHHPRQQHPDLLAHPSQRHRQRGQRRHLHDPSLQPDRPGVKSASPSTSPCRAGSAAPRRRISPMRSSPTSMPPSPTRPGSPAPATR